MTGSVRLQQDTWLATIHLNNKAVGSDAMPTKYLKDRRAVASWLFGKYPAITEVCFPVSGIGRNDGEIITRDMLRMPETTLTEPDALSLANVRLDKVRNLVYELQVQIRDNQMDAADCLREVLHINEKMPEIIDGLREVMRVKKEQGIMKGVANG